MGGGGGGGGGSQNSTSTVQQYDPALSPYAQSAADRMLTYSNRGPTLPTTSFVAGAAPLQQQSFNDAAALTRPGEFGAATNAALAGTGPNMQQGMATAGLAGTMTNRFPNMASVYMNPYVEGAINVGVRRANEDFVDTTRAINNRAIAQGGLGGYRNQLAQMRAQELQNRRVDDIVATGLDRGMQFANTAFNADENRIGQAASQLGSLGNQISANRLQGAQVLSGIGTNVNAADLAQINARNQLGGQQRGIAQDQLAEQQAQFEYLRDWDRNAAMDLANVVRGAPQSSVQYNRTPAPSLLVQGMGAYAGLRGLGGMS